MLCISEGHKIRTTTTWNSNLVNGMYRAIKTLKKTKVLWYKKICLGGADGKCYQESEQNTWYAEKNNLQ